MEDAKALEELARLLEEQKDYAQAKIHYQYAKAVYVEIGKITKRTRCRKDRPHRRQRGTGGERETERKGREGREKKRLKRKG